MIGEILSEIVGALLELFLTSKKIPFIIRLIVAVLVFAPLSALCIWLAFTVEGTAAKIAVGAIALLITFGGYKFIRKILESR
ncbi:MAG: hypothetical protein IJ740_00485 [Ruminococcus sp.]|nr:hypothetical protein [Ruminococcus sp.]